MGADNSDIRERLDSLLTLVVNKMVKKPPADFSVTGKFLKDNGIHLYPHDFSATGTTEANVKHNPPILFKSCPLEVIKKHPIDLSRWKTTEEAEKAMKYPEYKKNKDERRPPAYVMDYIYKWVFNGFRREMLSIDGFYTLRDMT